MGFFSSFFQKNVEPTYPERLLRIETRLTRLEADILDLATSQDILRNKVLRKIQVKHEPKEEGEDLNKTVILPEPYGYPK